MILQIPLSAAGVSFVMRRSFLIKRKSVFVYSPSPYAAEDTLIEIFASFCNIENYDYHFSTPTKNAVNKRIIERCIAAVFVVCQRDNHIEI